MSTNPEPGAGSVEPRRVLIVGVSTRAAAESAARAGFEVIALDGYGDLDQHPAVRALSLSRDFGMAFSTDAIVRVAGQLSSDAVVYLSNLENHPKAVEVVASGRALWGNAPDVLRRVRHPGTLATSLAEGGIRVPRVLTSKPDTQSIPNTPWLIKPRVSGGGHGVRFWSADEPVTRDHYLQEFVEGVPGSVVFVAAGGIGVVLGISRQLVGETAFGVSGFSYCGNILDLRTDVIAPATTLVQALSAAFPLVGVGSIDFIATDTGLSPVEVNPRWTASMELVERAQGISMFGVHADACTRAVLPPFDLTRRPAPLEVHGKAIVFARENVVVGDTSGWLTDSSVRDIPREGERIPAGQPICTVFAVGSDDAVCHQRLVERAERIYGEV